MWIQSLWTHDRIAFQWGVVIAGSLIALLYDVDCRRIPNSLTGPLALLGAGWAMVVAGWGGLADATVAAVILATPFILLFLFAGGGAGDAKMMGAIGMWLGLVNGMIVLAAVTMAGMLWAIGLAAAKHRLQAVLADAALIAARPMALLVGRGRLGTPGTRMQTTESEWTFPYAVAIFTGVCAAAGGIMLWRM